MSLTVVMPQLGLTMTEGTVSEWLKKPGEAIRKDEMIFVLSTDKADMEVESIVEGTLREIVIDKGQTVPVGTVLAYVDPPGTAEKVSSTAVAGLTEPVNRSGHVLASPRARRLAKQMGIDIATVSGTGPGSRIIEEDVITAGKTKPAAAITDQYTKRRQLIAQRMVESVTTIPAFSLSLEINAEQLVYFYENLREAVSRSAGSKLTYTDLLLKAVAIALAKNPDINARWKDGRVERQNQIDLGLAIATDTGIVAPKIRNVPDLPLEQLVSRRADLAHRARQGRLFLDDLEGGAGTLSNVGMYRVDRFQGIITPGQSFLLAVGKLRNRPWVDAGLVVKPTLILTLSVDHRVMDGVAGAVFLESIAEVIENPYRILWSAQSKQ